jgi:hypothetical protein
MTKSLALQRSRAAHQNYSVLLPSRHVRVSSLLLSRTTVRSLRISTGCKGRGRRNSVPSWSQQSRVCGNGGQENKAMNLTTNAREDMPLVAGYGQRSPDDTEIHLYGNC